MHNLIHQDPIAIIMIMKKLFLLLIFAALFNALSWIILIPLWQYPDEQAHFAQVQDMAETGKVPAYQSDTSEEIARSEKILQTERDQTGNNNFVYHPWYRYHYSNNLYGPGEKEIAGLPKSSRTNLVKNEATHNPPLYYFAGSQVYKIFAGTDLFGRVYAVRLLSSVFFILTVYASFKMAGLIFGQRPLMAIGLTGMIAFMPMFVFSSTGILPDPLTNLLFTVVLFTSLKILLDGLNTKYILILILSIIVGVWTRQQFQIAIPIVFLPVTYQLVKKPKYLKWGFLAFGVFALFIYISIINSNFPFIGSFRIPEIGSFRFSGLLSRNFIYYEAASIKHFIAETLPWYWGIYKWLSLAVPHPVYKIINRVLALAAAGIVIKFFILLKNKRITKEDKILIFMIAANVIYFLAFNIWDYFFQTANGFSFGYQGRYFFPLITFQIAIILIGLNQIAAVFPSVIKKWLIFALMFSTLLFNILSLFYVASSYYSVNSLTNFLIEASQYKPPIFKGNLVLIILTAGLILESLFLLKFAKQIRNIYNKER